jgi:poly-gamma-glutamate synthesis protein (capsule biosynthesis protein)
MPNSSETNGQKEGGMNDQWLLGAVGDIFINRAEPEMAFEHVSDLLHAPSIQFGNCEGAFTDSATVAPSAGFRVVSATRNGSHLRAAGFDVMAAANNHIVDAGHEGLIDTLELLEQQGVVVCGAGRDRASAIQPALLEAHGIRVAFLSYTTIIQAGYDARPGVPGCAYLRVHSVPYFPDWDCWGRLEPGAVPHMRTFTYPEDRASFCEAVKRARDEADVVVVSMHWGDSRLPVVLTDYEIELGHAAIDSGADVVLGHHHHFLKAIEFYRGKPIFYGMGHFVFDLIGLEAVLTPAAIAGLRGFSNGYGIYPRADQPGFPFHPDARMTLYAGLFMRGASIEQICVVPCLIDPSQNNRPVPLSSHSADGRRVSDYLRSITAAVGFNTVFGDDGPEIAGYRSLRVLPGVA